MGLVARRKIAVYMAASALLFLAGCGGGNSDRETARAEPQSEARQAGLAVPGAPSTPAASSIVIESLTKLAERRISRTVWEYTYSVTVKNIDSVAGRFVVELGVVPRGSIVVDGILRTGQVPALGSVTPADTITIQHDRTVQFDPENLSWIISAESISTVVAVPSDLPPAVRASITDLASPAGQGSLGEAIPLPSLPAGGAALTLALDSLGQLRLAGFASGPATTLDADTTALALVYMVLGTRSGQSTYLEQQAWIRSAASFSRLVMATDSAIRSDITPPSDPRVASAIFDVVAELDGTRGVQVNPQRKGALGSRFRQSASSSNIFPIRLLGHTSQSTWVYAGVSGGDSDSLDVINNFPIGWSLQLFDQNRASIGNHVLSPADLEKVLIPYLPSNIFKILAPGETGVYLELSQTNASRSATVGSIISSVGAIALSSVARSDSWKQASLCFTPTVSALAGKKILKAGFENATVADLLIDMFKPSELTELLDIIVGCSFETATDITAKESLSKVLSGILKSLNGLSKVFDAFQIGSTVWQVSIANQYWSFDTLGLRVCRNLTGEIDGCVSELRPVGGPVVALEGVRIDVLNHIKAFDKLGNEVGLPAGLQVIGEGSVNVESASTIVRTTSIGSGRIMVADPVSGKSALPLAVEVVEPSIEVLEGTLKVGGGPLVMGIRDNRGRAVRMPPSSSWELEVGVGQDVLLFNPLLNLLLPGTYPSRVILGIERSGDTFVQFTNGETGKAVQRRISITNPGPESSHWVLQLNAPTDFTPLPPDLEPNAFTTWVLEPPFRVYGNFQFFNGASGIRFYFDDDSPEVVLEHLGQAPMKRVSSLAWRSYHPAFFIDAEVLYEQMLQTSKIVNGTWELKKMTTSGQRSTQMRVSARSESSMSGTYDVRTISGAFKLRQYGGSDYTRWTTVPTEARGTWSAFRVNGPAPRPWMNGFSNCAATCFGGSNCGGRTDRQCSSTILPAACGPWLPQTCRY